MTRRKRNDLHAAIDEEWLGTDEKGVCPTLHECSKGGFDFVARLCFENVDLPPDCRRRRFRVRDDGLCGDRICWIDKERDPRSARRQLVQQVTALAAKAATTTIPIVFS